MEEITWAKLLVLLTIITFINWLVSSYFYYKKEQKELKTVRHRDYKDDFYQAAGPLDDQKLEKLIDAILDIRKFEIDLYWKRAAYFWAFIVLTYTGYGILENQRQATETPGQLEWFVSALGLFLSVAWHLVNRGSKYWQENWENHLDLLEDYHFGPLYKTVISRPQRDTFDLYRRTRDVIVGPAPYSVSKINSVLSSFNILVWGYIVARLLGWTPSDLRIERATIVIGTMVSIAVMMIITRTDNEHHLDLQAKRRETRIHPK